MPVGFISGGGSDNKIQIGCNIRQLPQFVNVWFPTKAAKMRPRQVPARRRARPTGRRDTTSAQTSGRGKGNEGSIEEGSL